MNNNYPNINYFILYFIKEKKVSYILFSSKMDLNSNKLFLQNSDSLLFANTIKEKLFEINKIPKNRWNNRYYRSNYIDIGVQTDETKTNCIQFERDLFNFYLERLSMNTFRNFNIYNNYMLKNQLNFYTTNFYNNIFPQRIEEISNNIKTEKDPTSQPEINKFHTNLSPINPVKSKKLNIFGSGFNFSESGNTLKTNIIEDINKNAIKINYNYLIYNHENKLISRLINIPQSQQMQVNKFFPLYNNDVSTPKMPPFFWNPFQKVPQNINKNRKFLMRKKFRKKIKKIDKENIIKDGKKIKFDFSDTIDTETNKIKFLPKPIKSIKGRKKKIFEGMGKHTKFSKDNMMKKIKIKVLEYCRSLINKILNDELVEFNNEKRKIVSFLSSTSKSSSVSLTDLMQSPPINEDGKIQEIGLRKIRGFISQELNVKFNFWFYLLKIKEIFIFDLNGKYTLVNKTSNNELIKFLFNENNSKYFKKSRQILDMAFHQFYHDIFLNEDTMWKKRYGIPENNINYQIDRLLISLEKNGKENYYEKINNLAHEYEDFFLEKIPRTSFDIIRNEKKIINNFINGYLDQRYNEYFEKVKQLKEFYTKRKLFKEGDMLRTDDVEKCNNVISRL